MNSKETKSVRKRRDSFPRVLGRRYPITLALSIGRLVRCWQFWKTAANLGVIGRSDWAFSRCDGTHVLFEGCLS